MSLEAAERPAGAVEDAELRSRAVAVAGLLAALALRLAILVHFRGNFDVGSYGRVAEIVLRGGDLYRETTQYKYAPPWAFVVSGAERIAQDTGVAFADVVGGLLLLTDAVTAALLFVLGGASRRGRTAAVLFFANPVSVLCSSFYLQFDDIAILFLLAAIWAARYGRRGRLMTAAALSASLLIKHVTGFFPLVFGARRRQGTGVLAASIPYLAFGASFLPFWHLWPEIRANVLAYRGGLEPYGLGRLRDLAAVPEWVPSAVFLAAVGAAIAAGRSLELSRACLLLFLVMLLFTPGICEYYFVWPIALGSLTGGAGYAVYTVVTSAFYMGGSLYGLHVPSQHFPDWGGVWWSLVFWYAWDERRRRRERLT